MKNIVPKLELISHENNGIGTLAKYLLDYEDDLAELTISKLSEDLFISIATATRLSKRLELDGFSQLKIHLAQEKYHRQNVRKLYEDEIYENYYEDITKALTMSLTLIDNQTVQAVSDEIGKGSKINFFAVGSSNIAVRYVAQKLYRINKAATHHSDPHLQYVEAMNSNSTVVAVGVSYTGLTHEILANLQLSKNKGATTVLITTNRNLSYDFVDYIILTPDVNDVACCTSISNRFTCVVVLDLIYLNLIKSDPDYYRSLIDNNSYIK